MKKEEFVKIMEEIGADLGSSSPDGNELYYSAKVDIETYLKDDPNFQDNKQNFYEFYNHIKDPYINVDFEWYNGIESVTYCVTNSYTAGDHIEDSFSGVIDMFRKINQ
jgi:hypothetical protein